MLTPGKINALLTLFDLVELERKLKHPMSQEEKSAKANDIVRNHVGFSLGAALMPLPGADLLAVSAVQLNMLRQLAKLYNVGFMDALGKNIISAVVGSSAARLGASLVKAIPGVGTIIGELSMPALSGASTYALGYAVSNHFQNGGSLEDLDLKKARSTYESEVENGKKVATELTQTHQQAPTDATDATLDKVKKLAEMRDAGIITAEEFTQLKERLLAQL
jgi:uncharacterized protein (DUF697 family)